MSDIKVIISYSDKLESIEVDTNEMEDIYRIREKPINEWFSVSEGRDGWRGLIAEIKQFADDEQANLLFEFNGPDKEKELFKKCLGELGIDLKDDPTSEFDIKKYMEKAKKAEHLGHNSNAIKNYAKAALKGDADAKDRALSLLLDEDLDYDNYPKEGIDLLLKDAERGNPKAQVDLGCWYHVVKEDDSSALYWLNEAIKQDYWEAYMCEGIFCFNGWGLKQSDREAFELYRIAAVHGVPEAQYVIGNLYYNGVGTEKNNSLAFQYYKMAAEQGDIDSQQAVGTCLREGIGTQKDGKEALKWYRKAAEQGNLDSQIEIVDMFFDEDLEGLVDEKEAVKWCKMVAEEKEEAIYWTVLGNFYLNYYNEKSEIPRDAKEAIRCYNRAIELDNIRAILNLADLYQSGEIIEKNERIAFELYKKAANLDDAQAFFELGYCFENGLGVEEDNKEAFYWYKKSADKGYIYAQREVGFWYRRGLNEVEQNDEIAFKYFMDAAEQGDAISQNEVGDMYYEGEGTTKEYDKAHYWYKQAAEQENSNAYFNLGIMYENGEGVEKDKDIALQLFHKGADIEDSNGYCCLMIAEDYYSKLCDEFGGIGKALAGGAAIGAVAALIPVANIITIPVALGGTLLTSNRSKKRTVTDFLNSENGKEMIRYYQQAAAQGIEKAESRLKEFEKYI